jgi:branched-chain amino acid transport system permease protein
MASVYGPVVGAVLLITLPEAITFLNLPDNIMGPLQGVIFTLLVILFLFLRPQGLVAQRRTR